MAKLPNQTISTIFRLQQRLVALLDTATAADASEASIQEIKRSWNLP
jgi:hypothetical protein